MYVGYQFLIESYTTNRIYEYLVAQSFADSNSYLGGENIILKQDTRIPFSADVGSDKLGFIGDTVSIVAAEVLESVMYKWYEGSVLKHTGRFFNHIVDASRTFTLEVTSLTDGSIDYDNINVKLKDGVLHSVYPNPCTQSATVTYTLQGVSNASILVVHPLFLTQLLVPLNTNDNSVLLQLANIPSAVYSLILIADQKIQDIQSLIKQ